MGVNRQARLIRRLKILNFTDYALYKREGNQYTVLNGISASQVSAHISPGCPAVIPGFERCHEKGENIFSHIWSPGDGIQNWETYLLELNVRRIPCVAFIIVIFQIANFVIKETAGEVLPLWEFLPFIVFAAVYGLTALLIPYRIINRPQLARAFYLSFLGLAVRRIYPVFCQGHHFRTAIYKRALVFQRTDYRTGFFSKRTRRANNAVCRGHDCTCIYL